MSSKKKNTEAVKEVEVVKKGREPLPIPVFDPKKKYDLDTLIEVTRLFRAGKNQKNPEMAKQARALLHGIGMRFAEFLVVGPHLGLWRQKGEDGKVASVAEAKYAKIAEQTKVMFKKMGEVVEAEVTPKKGKAAKKEAKAPAPKRGRSAKVELATA